MTIHTVQVVIAASAIEDTTDVIQAIGSVIHAVPDIEFETLPDGTVVAAAEYTPRPEDIIIEIDEP